MVYKMNFYADGGCRRNGQAYGAIGAAAAVWEQRYRNVYRTRALPPSFYHFTPKPTNQRAELTAIILALEWALERYAQLRGYPKARIRIYSDSDYAINCLTTWIWTWRRNGWQNAKGLEVANRDLLEQVLALEYQVRNLGSLRYEWIPRGQNHFADQCCNEKLDEMEGYY
ncbi:ribonuclease H1 [Apiospora rasikravindrae]|uniref:ribonuclease H n=1 Tax=Apiospora rasikravindrae TaxID=990691 RepID=A0ABR1SX91_9PEZI